MVVSKQLNCLCLASPPTTEKDKDHISFSFPASYQALPFPSFPPTRRQVLFLLRIGEDTHPTRALEFLNLLGEAKTCEGR